MSFLISNILGLDILINNVGIVPENRSLMRDMPVQQFQDVLQVIKLNNNNWKLPGLPVE